MNNTPWVNGGRYILVDKIPVPEPDLFKWGKWFQNSERHVAQTTLHVMRGKCVYRIWISTVFLGLDHNFFGEGGPLLFETMIFGGPIDEYQDRCCTWDEAITMHERAHHHLIDHLIHHYRILSCS